MSEPVPVEMWATRRGEHFAHFYPHPALVRLCISSRSSERVLRVRLSPNDAGDYWAWWNSAKATMQMVWYDKRLLLMCSPDGFERADRNGEGKVTSVRVDVLREATVEEQS